MAYSVRRTPSSRARPVGWNNSFRYSLGLRYDPTRQWSLRLGTAYDETPGPSDVLRTPASRTPTAFRRSGLPSVGPTACASISGADPTKIRVRFGSCGVLGEGDIRPNADAGAPRRGSGPPPPRRGAAPARNRGAARRVRRDGPPPRASGRAPEHAPPPHGAPHPARAGAALRHPGDAALARGRGPQSSLSPPPRAASPAPPPPAESPGQAPERRPVPAPPAPSARRDGCAAPARSSAPGCRGTRRPT